MKNPKRELEDFERFEEVIEILFRQGFGALLDRLDLSHHISTIERVKKPRKKTPGPERLRETFEELGPTFIKFGQIMAQRPDIIPQRYTEELQKLEDDVPAFDSSEAMEIIREEVDIEKFEYIQEKPIAAASIAQVHRARLKTGEDVVVKVRRPGIKQQMQKDLDILDFLTKKAEKEVQKLRELKAHKMVEEFASWTRDELDLQKEARNAQTLQRNLADEENVEVPEIFMEHTTEKVLVMEYMEGVKCDNQEKLQQMDIEAEKIARTAIRAGLKQVIRDGFFHADPHPSNFLIQQDGKLVYLDFGMMGKFSKQMQDDLGMLFLHAANEDVEAAVEIVEQMATVEENADREGLKRDIEEKLLLVRNSTLEDHSISQELLDITIRAAERGYHMPVSFAIVGKSLVTMEGIGLTIYPQFRVTEEYEDTARQILLEKNDPSEMLQNLLIDAVKNKEFLSRPFTHLRNMTGQRREVVENYDRENSLQVLVAGLLVSSGLIISQSLTNDVLAVIGIAQLLIATLLSIEIVRQ